MAVFRALLASIPLLINFLGSHPPKTLPKVDTMYTTATAMGHSITMWCSPSAMCRAFSPSRNAGNQNKKNHHIGSVRNFPKKNAHVCRYASNLNQETFSVEAAS